MYDTRTIHDFKKNPFPEVEGMTFGQMTDEQGMMAHENWIRAQFWHFDGFHRAHISLLLKKLDEAREDLEELHSK